MVNLELPASAKGVRLDGKTVIVTGANSGIGKETARELARAGARVILACRNLKLAKLAQEDIVASTGNRNVVVKILDLANLASVRKFADDINATEPRLDILVNNAAVFSRTRKETKDGFELSFGTNHLGPFVLTNLLLEKLKSSAPSRVVMVSSLAHSNNPVDFDDLQTLENYGAFNAYGKSKSANIMYSVHLAKQLAGSGVTTYSLHPGEIHTNISRDYSIIQTTIGKWILGKVMHFHLKRPIITAEEGALTTLYCCLEPSIANVSGKYYSFCKEARVRSHATDEERAQRLWDISSEMSTRVMSKL